MTDLATIRQGWEYAAHEDAFANILTSGQWTSEAFFANGEEEISRAMARLERLGITGPRRRALDFGCGPGRCSRALAQHYRRVDGVDISPEMIRLAKELDDTGRCTYKINSQPDLSAFRSGTFDLVYSYLVLQHQPRPLAEQYVREFVRVLKASGVAMFEAPDGPDVAHTNHWLSMTGLPRAEVEHWLTDAGAVVLDVELLDEPSIWQCYVYTAQRTGGSR